MSWYTTIYPTEEFNLNVSRVEVLNRIQTYTTDLNNIWMYIHGLCMANPKIINGEDSILYAIDYTNKYFNRYLLVSEKQVQASFLSQMLDNKEIWEKYPENEKEYRPHIWYNHFKYSNDPESGIEDCNDNIEYIRKRLISYACACPKDIIVDNSDGDIKDHTLYLIGELEDLRQWLDSAIYDLEFCKLLNKYFDTKEEG